MASSIVSSAAVTSVSRASPAKAAMVAPFTGLKSASAFPVTRKLNTDITSIASNGGRVQCMQVWPPHGKKKFETLSYLPPLSAESLAKEVDYLIRKGWIPCLEFELEVMFQISVSLFLTYGLYAEYYTFKFTSFNWLQFLEQVIYHSIDLEFKPSLF
ncbi:hypothetical protein F2P56_012708 [Juglans regia]|uniref:Ribulose bisphosphate carboxylase small subunit n=1 Tax=Juglans regia TaxID=51240 RepID=A0A834CUT4_JUGRE|nr:hypothetical protein F2P56_012708 [Juglans regia]